MKPAQEAQSPRAPIGGQNPFLRTIHLNDGDGGAPDYAGYPSLDKLVDGYRSSSTEAQRQRARADEAERRAALLEQQYARPQVPQRGDPSARLAEYGVPVDALDEYVNSRISAGVAAAFEPVMKGATARNQMLSQYADYNKFESEVATYVNGDPQLSQSYQKMFSVDPVAAMEFAFLKFGETKRRAAPPTPGNGNGATPQAQARAEAQIPSSRAGDARTMPAAQGDEQLQRGWDHFQKTGDPRAYAKMRLRQVISDEFLNG